MTIAYENAAGAYNPDKWLRALGQASLAMVAVVGIALSAFEFGQDTRRAYVDGVDIVMMDGNPTIRTAEVRSPHWVRLPTEALPKIVAFATERRAKAARQRHKSFGPYTPPVTTVAEREASCLAQAVYYEARGESRAGQIAVAQVVMNRVGNPNYPGSICGVVFQGMNTGKPCQFSFACDGSMKRRMDRGAWNRSVDVARAVLDGQSHTTIASSATHFHTTAVNPKWSRTLVRVAQVGTHIFYRFPRGGERVHAPRMSARAPAEIAAVDTAAPTEVAVVEPLIEALPDLGSRLKGMFMPEAAAASEEVIVPENPKPTAELPHAAKAS